MQTIVNYTTPTITWSFSTVTPSDISEAYLTVEQGGEIILEKELSDMTVGEDSISYTMAQAESALIGTKSATVVLNWKLEDGTRGVGETLKILGARNPKDEVI